MPKVVDLEELLTATAAGKQRPRPRADFRPMLGREQVIERLAESAARADGPIGHIVRVVTGRVVRFGDHALIPHAWCLGGDWHEAWFDKPTLGRGQQSGLGGELRERLDEASQRARAACRSIKPPR